MRKIIAAINMTVDGFCDHTAGIADDELHLHYEALLRSAGTILYGRITYRLMEYWRTVIEKPTGNKSMDDFAVTMDRIPKIVFSNTLKTVDWKTATLARHGLREEVMALKQSHYHGKEDILVGSPSLISALAGYHLIDEFQLCFHPVILGNGETILFKNIQESIKLELIKTKPFSSGAIVMYYKPKNG